MTKITNTSMLQNPTLINSTTKVMAMLLLVTRMAPTTTPTNHLMTCSYDYTRTLSTILQTIMLVKLLVAAVSQLEKYKM